MAQQRQVPEKDTNSQGGSPSSQANHIHSYIESESPQHLLVPTSDPQVLEFLVEVTEEALACKELTDNRNQEPYLPRAAEC